MFERFTERARKVMALANQEAQRFNHEYIGTEHILLGLVKEGTGVGPNVLKNLGVDLHKVRMEVEKLVKTGPDMVTLVPEKREEVTTEGGLDVQTNYDRLAEAVPALRNGNILVSLFIDPDIEQIKASARLQADYVEIHTGMYAEAKDAQEEADELEKIRHACGIAARLGFGVAAGHGLTYQNVRPIAAIPEVEELNIGHTIVSRAVMTGMERAVREMLEIIHGS